VCVDGRQGLNALIVYVAIGVCLFCLLMLLPVLVAAWRNGSYVWLPSLLWRTARTPRPHGRPDDPLHVLFLVVDHFEPKFGGADSHLAKERVETWAEEYPRIADGFADSDGYPPRYTWFFPYHEFEPDLLARLSTLCFDGWGEIEMHLHHGDCARTPEQLERLLRACVDAYSEFGIFTTLEDEPQQTYGFIHGMWALDDADHRYCGVRNEFQLLAATGCYADFSLPAPGKLQPKKVNAIYYVQDDPNGAKSHDRGVDVEVGRPPSGDLMLVSGPIAVDWRTTFRRFYPRIDMGEISETWLPDVARLALWVRANVHVVGQNRWVFAKAFAHGAPDPSASVLLGDPMRRLHEHLHSEYNDGERFCLHYVTAREAYNIVKAAEAGMTGNPNAYRDFAIPPYANTQIACDARYRVRAWGPTRKSIQILEAGDVCVRLKACRVRKVCGPLNEIEVRETPGGGVQIELYGKGHAEIEWEELDGSVRQRSVNVVRSASVELESGDNA